MAVTPIKPGTASRLGIRQPPSDLLRLTHQMLNSIAGREKWVWTRDRFDRAGLTVSEEERS